MSYHGFGIWLFAYFVIGIAAIIACCNDNDSITEIIPSTNEIIIHHQEGGKTFVFYADKRDSSVYRMDFYTDDSLKTQRYRVAKDIEHMMYHKEMLSEKDSTILVIAKLFPINSEDVHWMQRKVNSFLQKTN